MGLFICEKHGRSSIVQMSRNLHQSYLTDSKDDVVMAIFRVEALNEDLVHYFSKSDDITNFINAMHLESFEKEFSKISSDPVACVRCFQDYVKENDIEVNKQVLLVKNTDSTNL
ncbi:hypothetical protein [Aquimarina spongiae]|uniref:Uncharacterized protein n=1 Tax=Aquimarina spongiae TaxID=570521 RepID=A0A1M6L8X1_9FLAO|nr:hypothetical protein [Aquimarina spongiae]SHJ67613.1 hypothetical protein SAMN04488508_11458 [Aquimarina spongiae]